MKQRDIELLSSYLDGQLSSGDSARLETRLRTDPALRSVLQDLRSARTVLRQLPMRKAPRNFTLTPKMVGRNPPLPRSYPVFRFAATLATILLFFTFGLNFMGRQLAAQPPMYGMGGGGAVDTFESAVVTEPPAAAAEAATELPAEEPSIAMAPPLTATLSAEEAANARAMETAVSKEPGADPGAAADSGPAQGAPQAPAETASAQSVSRVWQWLLAGIALVSVFIMVLMRQVSANRWRSKG
jgi:anti-sigma factor RsiW